MQNGFLTDESSHSMEQPQQQPQHQHHHHLHQHHPHYHSQYQSQTTDQSQGQQQSRHSIGGNGSNPNGSQAISGGGNSVKLTHNELRYVLDQFERGNEPLNRVGTPDLFRPDSPFDLEGLSFLRETGGDEILGLQFQPPQSNSLQMPPAPTAVEGEGTRNRDQGANVAEIKLENMHLEEGNRIDPNPPPPPPLHSSPQPHDNTTNSNNSNNSMTAGVADSSPMTSQPPSMTPPQPNMVSPPQQPAMSPPVNGVFQPNPQTPAMGVNMSPMGMPLHPGSQIPMMGMSPQQLAMNMQAAAVSQYPHYSQFHSMGFNPLGMHTQPQQPSEGGSSKKASHAPSEKARRDRINEYIDKLRQVVPLEDRRDKASVLRQTVAYIQGLKAHIEELEKQLSYYNNNTNSAMPMSKSHQNLLSPSAPNPLLNRDASDSSTGVSRSENDDSAQKVCPSGDEVKSEPRSCGLSAEASEEVSITPSSRDGVVYVSVRCRDRAGLLRDLLGCMYALSVNVITAQVQTGTDGHVTDTFEVDLTKAGVTNETMRNDILKTLQRDIQPGQPMSKKRTNHS